MNTPDEYYDQLMAPLQMKNIMFMVAKILLSFENSIFGYK
jgi:hypothetical protein